jgi:hypothetical protein
MVTEWGTKWTRIAAILKGRSDIEVKMRWLRKFNDEHPMFPKSRRLESQEQRVMASTGTTDDAGQDGYVALHDLLSSLRGGQDSGEERDSTNDGLLWGIDWSWLN